MAGKKGYRKPVLLTTLEGVDEKIVASVQTLTGLARHVVYVEAKEPNALVLYTQPDRGRSNDGNAE